MDTCCDMMKHALAGCTVHGDRCPDAVIVRQSSGTYAIPVNDGGSSGLTINFCPWCRASLVPKPTPRVLTDEERQELYHGECMGPGCKEQRQGHVAFCPSCLEEYKEDPDAFK